MIRHIVLFRWKPGTTAAQVAAVQAGLNSLAGQVPSIRGYAHGADLQLGDGRWDYGVAGDFDDTAGYQLYADHPAHDAVLSEVVAPLLADRAAVQIQL